MRLTGNIQAAGARARSKVGSRKILLVRAHAASSSVSASSGRCPFNPFSGSGPSRTTSSAAVATEEPPLMTYASVLPPNFPPPPEVVPDGARISDPPPVSLNPKFDIMPMSQIKPGVYRMHMGLEPMTWDNFIWIDDAYDEEMAMRRHLLESDKRRLVLKTAYPEAEAANRELLEVLATHLPTYFPEIFQMDGNVLHNLRTRESFDITSDEIDPLEAAARLVQEDLCLMVKDSEGVQRFMSGAVLFPQRWSLLEKLGMDMHHIHLPVPRYRDEIERPALGFMDRLKTEKPFWRANWTINADRRLFQPADETEIAAAAEGRSERYSHSHGVTAENAGEMVYLRVERETLTRLPRTQAVLFTIRTFIRPLEYLKTRPEDARRLSEAVLGVPEDVAMYKTISEYRHEVATYLSTIAAERGY